MRWCWITEWTESHDPRLSRGLEEALEGLHAGTHLKMHRKIFHLHHSHCCPQVGKVAFTARHSENNFWLLFASLIALNAKAFYSLRQSRRFLVMLKLIIKNHYPMWNWVVILGADGGILPRPCNSPQDCCSPAGRKAPGMGCSNPTLQPLQSLLQK